MTIRLVRPSLLFALSSLVASGCDPASGSLGEETESSGASESGTSDADTPPMADAQRLARLEGISLEDFVVRPDGSVVAIGSAGYRGTSGDAPIFDTAWMGAFDVDGALAWERTSPFDETGPANADPQFTSITAAADGSVFVSVIDSGEQSDSQNPHVVKYGPQGGTLWAHPSRSWAQALSATPEGGVVAVGSIRAEGTNDTSHGWAIRIDADGATAVEQTWVNDGGRSTRLMAAATDASGRILVGGSWGTTHANYLGQAWLAWLDEDLQTLAEVRLPDDGEFGRIETVRIDADGNGLAYGVVGSFATLSLTPQGEVLSVTPVSPLPLWSDPYGPEAYFGSAAPLCDSGDQFSPQPCSGTVLQAMEAETVQWQASFGGCGLMGAHAESPHEAMVIVRCASDTVDTFGLAGELWRVTAP